MKCKDCGYNNKLLTHYCINCGKPTKYPFYLQAWFWVIVEIIMVGIDNVPLTLITFAIVIYMVVIDIKHNKVIKAYKKSYLNALDYDSQNISNAPFNRNIGTNNESHKPRCKESPNKKVTFDVEAFNSIPPSEIVLEKKTINNVEQFEKVHYTNVTVRTNYDKLGNFVVIDTETTGLNGKNDKIVELAAIRFEKWEAVEKFETLVNPRIKIPKAASSKNNIYDDMVQNSPSIEEVIKSFSDFIKGYSIVGQNLNFDLEFLHYAGAEYRGFKTKYYDTIDLAKKILTSPRSKVFNPELGYTVPVEEYDVENYKLSTLAEYYGIGDDSLAHRAAYDAFITGLVFKKIVDQKISRNE
ncbi:3'-5' exonuclease [Butyrivibrio sp. INlla14]|uniref:3'-5' exonuclease n=1 Tax=Butyrivibrio sp. INlla14 TaxID=1520808 RepID=UPI000876D3D4|nr:3'-5' exonuclease [Butyrivibrio sp. INlla14]SCY41987.1 Exonuclease [Butyrivibrio sp. INlla14]